MRSSTSIGANYCEANGASSRRDFAHRTYICKQEANETKYWLRTKVSLKINNLKLKITFVIHIFTLHKKIFIMNVSRGDKNGCAYIFLYYFLHNTPRIIS